MYANQYHFVEQWNIPGFSPRQVYEVLYNASILPQWWSGVYLEAVPMAAYERPIVGAKVRAKAKGFLPYTLNFVLEALALEPGTRVQVKASGDFDGVWTAVLIRDGAGTRVEIDWRVTVDKPLIRLLSPILKPLFAWNHCWTTPRGERGLINYLTAKHRRRLPVRVPSASCSGMLCLSC